MSDNDVNDPMQAGGRRRFLTVLFSDLTGSTRIGEQIEAESFAEVLRELRSAARAVVAKHGGQIARIQSDGVLAIFGYDGVHEDDGRRATEAALELQRSVGLIRAAAPAEAPSEPLSLHSGVHAGVCFVDVGDVERGRFEVLGDVPNLAARLAELAGPGEVCISEETLGPSANFFEIHQRQVIAVRGRTSPLAVCRVTGSSRARNRYEAGALRGLAPFVGRAAEVASLQACLRRAIDGQPQCLTVIGNPGVGKTRLLEEFAKRLEDEHCIVLRGFCESYLTAEPMQPFLQILRGLRNDATPSLSPWAAVDGQQSPEASRATNLASLAQRALQPAQSLIDANARERPSEAGQAIDIIARALGALAAEVPLVLVVDDWQWADDASVRIIDAVRRHPGRIFVLLATREPEADPLAMVRGEALRLGPLDVSAVADSVRHLLPGADPFLIADIHQDSGGNPLFVEELCHSAAARLAPGVTGARLARSLRTDRPYGGSAWLAALVESRVARLGTQDARAVRIASVIGNVFPRRLLAQVASIELDEEQMDALATQDFIYPADQHDMLRFKHGVTREVIYASVDLRERIAVHVSVARALDTRPRQAPPEDLLEVLAYHYAEGKMPRDAAHFAELAGDKAMAAHALDRARLQYAAALAALDQAYVAEPEFLLHWCAVAEKLGMACVFDALALTDATRLLQRAVELARLSEDAGAIARSEYWLAYNHYAKGHGRDALAHGTLALAAASSLADDRLTAQLRATMGQVCASVCRYEEALQLLDAAIDSKRARARRGSSVAVGSAFALAIKASVLGDRGCFDDAHACFDEMLGLLEGSHHQVVSSVRNWIGVVHLWQGRWADAAAMAESSMAIAQNVRSHLLLATSHSIRGYAHWRLHGTHEAMQAVRDGTDWIERRGGSLGSSLNYGWLLDIAENRHDAGDRRRLAAILLRRARQHDRLGEAMGCRAMARAAAKAHDPATAQRYLSLARRSAGMRESRHEHAATQLCEAEVCLIEGRRRAALAPLDAASEAFLAMRMPWHLQQAEALRRLV